MISKLRGQVRRLGSLQQSWLQVLIVIAVVLMVIAISVSIAKEPAKIQGVVTFNRQPRGHDASLKITAANLPPVGGVHHDVYQNCGIYASAIDTENAVHSLEHGAVWITYQDGLPEADIATLRVKVADQQYLMLSPYPGQRSPIVLTSWGVQLELDSVHDERFNQFIDRYRLGPLTPERGASCAGGFGDPMP